MRKLMAFIALLPILFLCSCRQDIPEAKPVIYLYPKEEMDVLVRLEYDGTLTYTFPRYHYGWKVHATHDGKLSIGDQEFNSLFWEGTRNAPYDLTKGFCVAQEDTEDFLIDALTEQGLTYSEIHEFITFWGPRMHSQPYNIISFQQPADTIHTAPEADTTIQVFMAWYGVSSYVEMEPQVFTTPTRDGFTVVEWGGAEIT